MIPLFKVHMPHSVDAPLLNTLHSGFVGEGPRVKEFEALLSNYFSCPYVLTLNTGTSALQLALRLANVGPGDEVISSPMTAPATNMPILAGGAKIVWADINPITGNIDPQSIHEKITKKTKVIIAMHWGGYPCDMEEINAIAKEHNIKVLEDAAHAFGAEYHGSKIGSHSDFVMFSLQAIKHITTVDGGLLLCKNKVDYRRGKLLRWYGIDREAPRKDFRCEEDIEEWGYKFHMNDVCATLGIEQLKYIESILKKHRDNASFFDQKLKDLKGINLIPWKADRLSAYWLYTIHVEHKDKFMSLMKDQGIAVSQMHARNDKHTAFSAFKSDLSYVDAFTKSMVCIPVGWWLSDQDREYIVQTIKKYCVH